MSTKIEWTSETWNPIIGCSKISPGCKNCYAERMANRLANLPATSYYKEVIWEKAWNGCVHFIESAIEKPFKWKKPRMIFVCSMGDLFHESVPFEWIDRVFRVMHNTHHHTYQILTKRPERILEYQEHIKNKQGYPIYFYDNIWLGVTAENQEQADNRIPILLKIPAKVRFVSAEPLLSDINIYRSCEVKCIKCNGTGKVMEYQDGKIGAEWCDCGGSGVDWKFPNWLICGPETGPGARPMQKEWIENLYQQCEAAGVSFFDKKNILGKDLYQFPK